MFSDFRNCDSENTHADRLGFLGWGGDFSTVVGGQVSQNWHAKMSKKGHKMAQKSGGTYLGGR